VIKFGRIKFRIKELVCDQPAMTSDELRSLELKEARVVKHLEPTNSDDQC
jgi:hypothetical protein